MISKAWNKQIVFSLFCLVLITTPLFGLLGGTPFLTTDFSELKKFLPGIYFTITITIIFWFLNTGLLLLGERSRIFSSILMRALTSILAGLILSFCVYSFFKSTNHDFFSPVPDGFQNKTPPPGDAGMNGRIFKLADSLFSQLNPAFKRIPPHGKPFILPLLTRIMTINLIILTLGELVFLYFRKQKVEQENTLLRQSNLEARNNQLKMQLHPHFLFNSLNTLRLLQKKDPDKAEEYLLKLSDILRYSTTTAMNDLVDVKEELRLCLSYLEMQQVRFGEMLHFNITNPALYKADGRLPVYALQLLAENAIKHNAFSIAEPLSILISYDETERSITVSNRIRKKQLHEISSKTGLYNLNERYRLLAGETIVISEDENEFSVKLKLLKPNQNILSAIL